jgi:poly(3-hydroxybutyrate) depolymerase
VIRLDETDDRLLLRELAQLHAAERAPELSRQRLIQRLSEEPGLSNVPRTNHTLRLLVFGLAAAVILGVGVYRAEWANRMAVPVSSVSPEPRAPALSPAEQDIPGRVAATVTGDEARLPVPDCPQRRMHYAKQTDPDVLRAGLTLHTFETDTESCGAITRRYLEYVPKKLPKDSPAPVLLLLHSGPDRAEGMRSIQTRRGFERLARRDGFIVVYASAVPSNDSDPNVPNEGRWRTQGFYNPQVNDEEYLQQVVEDMLTRRVIDGTNPVFLVGHAQGASMALEAAAHRPEFYAGVAAVMAYSFPPLGPEAVPGTRLSRALFVTQDAIGRLRTDAWAEALGVPRGEIVEPRVIQLPDRVIEGKGHASGGPIADSTRESTVQRIEMRSPDRDGPAVRLFDISHAGHFWPTPAPHDSERLIELYGFRNEDIDTAEEIWSFFSSKDPIEPKVLEIDDGFEIDGAKQDLPDW